MLRHSKGQTFVALKIRILIWGYVVDQQLHILISPTTPTSTLKPKFTQPITVAICILLV